MPIVPSMDEEELDEGKEGEGKWQPASLDAAAMSQMMSRISLNHF